MWKFVLPAAAVATAVAPTKQHLDFEGMAENFRSISQRQAAGEIMPQATFDQIRNFVDQISQLVKGELETDEAYAQDIYNKSKDEVEACDSDRKSTKDGDVAGKTGAATTANSNWRTCKGQEQTEYDNMTDHCTDVNTYVNDWNSEPHCTGVNFKFGDSDAVKIYMDCICEFVDAHKDIYYEKRWNCSEATQDHGDKVKECGNPGKQQLLDDAFCAEQKAIQDMCSDYKTCRDREEGELADIKATVMKWEAVMQTQRVALEQLICFGEHILDNDTDLTECNDLVTADCHGFTDCPEITYYEAAPRVKCTEPDVSRLPCTTEYEAKWYKDYPANGEVPAKACKTGCSVTFPFTHQDSGCATPVDKLVGASPAAYTPLSEGPVVSGKWDSGSSQCTLLSGTQIESTSSGVTDGFCCDALTAFLAGNLARGLKGTQWSWTGHFSNVHFQCLIDPYWGTCSSDAELENAPDDAAMEKLRAYLCHNKATCNYASTTYSGRALEVPLVKDTIPASGEWAALMGCNDPSTYCDA